MSEHIVSSYDEQLKTLHATVLKMGALCESQFSNSITALIKGDDELVDKIIGKDDRIDELEKKIDDQVVNLITLRAPMAIDLRETVSAMRIASELERIGDLAKNTAKRAKIIKGSIDINNSALIKSTAELVQINLKKTLDSYSKNDEKLALSVWNSDKEILLKKRYSAEKSFRFFGISSIIIALSFLCILLVNIFTNGLSAFSRTEILLKVNFNEKKIGINLNSTDKEIKQANFDEILQEALLSLAPNAPELKQAELIDLVSIDASSELKKFYLKNKGILNKTAEVALTLSDDLDQLYKGNFPRDIPEDRRRFSDFQLKIFDEQNAKNKIISEFNWPFIFNADSREPEIAGVGASLMGSFFTLIVCLLLSFPLGILAAIYLEEFAPKNKITEIIEVNVNNLAAVPSIVFGLLGLGIFLNYFYLPRSTPLVGGLVLALMTLPRIIIPCRAALKAVPPSIREGALALGASKVQTVFHNVVPLAMPGTLSGTIIGLSQALGETAPLLLIGMVAFINVVPSTPFDPSAVLPVQVYLWSESAERGFVEKTSATIIILIFFLAFMNSFAIYLRNKFEKKWS